MKGFLQFLSLTLLTQLVNAAQQLVLLPLQLKLWGATLSAEWYFVYALASIATMADAGLRVSGHRALGLLSSGSTESVQEVRQIWATIRALVMTVTVLLIGLAAVYLHARHQPFKLWMASLIVAIAAETLLIIRSMYLDTLGKCQSAEVCYLMLISIRAGCQIASLWLFDAGPAALSWIALLAGLASLIVQDAMFSEFPAMKIAAPLAGNVRLRVLATLPVTMTEPAANWVRLSLPVVILTAISVPTAVTTFIAVRAIFGIGRQVITQVARYTSANYARLMRTDGGASSRMAIRMLHFCCWLATACAIGLLTDRGRLLSFWVKRVDPQSTMIIIESFAIGAVGYVHQLYLSTFMRLGLVSEAAIRQYCYIAMMTIVALLGDWLRSTGVYLISVGFCELSIGVLFLFGNHLPWGRRGGFAGALCILTITICGVFSLSNFAGLFSSVSLSGYVLSGAVGGALLSALAVGLLLAERLAPDTLPYSRGMT